MKEALDQAIRDLQVIATTERAIDYFPALDLIWRARWILETNPVNPKNVITDTREAHAVLVDCAYDAEDAGDFVCAARIRQVACDLFNVFGS